MSAHYQWIGDAGNWSDPNQWSTTDGTTPLPSVDGTLFIPATRKW
jgi:hypothetical protein